MKINAWTLVLIGIGIAAFFLIVASPGAKAWQSGDSYSGSGDWTINNPTVVADDSITVYGNVEINSNLEVYNSQIYIACDYDNEYSVDVSSTGSLYLWDSSTLVNYDYYNHYSFTDYGTLDINESTVQYMWGDTGNWDGGIQIYSSGANIRNSDISYGMTGGIYISDVSASITYNNIHDCGAAGGSSQYCYGIYVTSDGTTSTDISYNNIYNNQYSEYIWWYGSYTYYGYGIYSTGQSSSDTITNNDIYDNGFSMWDNSQGYQLYLDSSSPSIKSDTFTDGEYGIYATSSTPPTISDCTFSTYSYWYNSVYGVYETNSALSFSDCSWTDTSGQGQSYGIYGTGDSSDSGSQLDITGGSFDYEQYCYNTETHIYGDYYTPITVTSTDFYDSNGAYIYMVQGGSYCPINVTDCTFNVTDQSSNGYIYMVCGGSYSPVNIVSTTIDMTDTGAYNINMVYGGTYSPISITSCTMNAWIMSMYTYMWDPYTYMVYADYYSPVSINYTTMFMFIDGNGNYPMYPYYYMVYGSDYCNVSIAYSSLDMESIGSGCYYPYFYMIYTNYYTPMTFTHSQFKQNFPSTSSGNIYGFYMYTIYGDYYCPMYVDNCSFDQKMANCTFQTYPYMFYLYYYSDLNINDSQVNMSVNTNPWSYYGYLYYMYIYYYSNIYSTRTTFWMNNCTADYCYGIYTYQGGFYMDHSQYILSDNRIQYNPYFMYIQNGGLWMENSSWLILNDRDVNQYPYRYTYCAMIQQGGVYISNSTVRWELMAQGPYVAPPSLSSVSYYGFYDYAYSSAAYMTVVNSTIRVTTANQSEGGWIFYPNGMVHCYFSGDYINVTSRSNGNTIWLNYANGRQTFTIENCTIEYQTLVTQPMRGGIIFNEMEYDDLYVNDTTISMRNDAGFYPFNMFCLMYYANSYFLNCNLSYNIGGGDGRWGACDASPVWETEYMYEMHFISSTFTVTTRDEPTLLRTFNFTYGASTGVFFDHSKMIWDINSPNSQISFLWFVPGNNPSLGVLNCKDSALTMNINRENSPATMIAVVPGSGLANLEISNTILTLTQIAPSATPSTIIYMESQKGSVFNNLVMNLNGPTLAQDPSQSTVIMGVEFYKSIGTINNFTINGNGQGRIYGVGCDIVSMPTFNGCTINDCYAGLYANFYSMPILVDSYINNCVNGILLTNASNATLESSTINGTTMGAQLMDNSWLSLYDSFITNSTTSIFLSESTAWSLNSTFDKATVFFNDANATLIINWKLQLHVTWQNGAIIPYAAVSVIDNLGRPQMSTTADENGLVPWFVVTEYIETNYNVKTYFSPYTINATIGDLSNTTSVTTDITKEATVIIGDPFPPVVTITSPADNTFQNFTTVNLAGTATDIGSGINMTSFSYDGINWQSMPATRLWVYTMEVPEGVWTLQVQLTDIAGESSVATLTITVDLTPPMINVQSPANNSLGNIIGVDIKGVVEIGSVFTVDHRPVPVGPDGSFVYSLRLVEGSNTFALFARDRAGNTNSTTWTLLLDITPPALSVSSPVDGFLTNQNTTQVTGKTEAGAALTVNGVAVTVQPDGTFTYTFTLANGANPISVVSSDKAGNKATVLRTVLMNNVIHLNVRYPTENMMTNQITILVQGTTDTDALVRLNGGLVTVGSDGNFSVTYTLSEGTNELKFAGLDSYGNAISLTRHVILDTIAPALNIESPSPNDILRTQSVPVNGTCEPGINLTINGQPVDTSSGTFSTTLTLPEGSDIISVEGSDLAGNTVSFQIPVLIDLTAPSLEIVEPLDGFRTRDLTVVVVGITEPGATVTVNGVPVVVDPFGKFSTSVTLQKGNNPIKVTSSDAAGNTASKSIAVKNTVAPASAAQSNWWWTAIGILLALGIMVPLTILLVNMTLKSRSKKEGAQ